MLKKMGMVTVGVTAGLLAAAPLASASECVDGHDGGNNNFNADCAFNGGHAAAASDISGDSLANAVAQAPIAGNNVGNIADCSSFLNNNLNGNFSGNNVALFDTNYAPKELAAHKAEAPKVDGSKAKEASETKAPSASEAKEKAKEAAASKSKAPSPSEVKTTKLNGKSPSLMSF